MGTDLATGVTGTQKPWTKENRMQTVYKYPFELTPKVSFDLPAGAAILRFYVQPLSGPCMWAQVDPSFPKEKREFRIYGTGHAIEEPETLKHLATFFDGPYVWHVYEVVLTELKAA